VRGAQDVPPRSVQYIKVAGSEVRNNHEVNKNY
jgi:hypothetical protein